jgi:hypothetical protein
MLALDSPCVLAEITTMSSPTGAERFVGLAAMRFMPL